MCGYILKTISSLHLCWRSAMMSLKGYVASFELLGVWHQNSLKCLRHDEKISKRANKRLNYLGEYRCAMLPAEVGIMCYLTKIRPLLEYSSRLWVGHPAF